MVTNKTLNSRSKLFPWFAGTLLSGLAALALLIYWKGTRQITDEIIHQDVVQLQSIFNRIHKDCSIASFAHVKNTVDFLTVISFVGSQIGPMNLVSAKYWNGAYLKTNPKIQEQLYVVLKNKQGYFIVPGDGVTLNNGKVIGKDLILDYDSDMLSLVRDVTGLLSSSGVLAAPIHVGASFLDTMQLHPEMLQVID